MGQAVIASAKLPRLARRLRAEHAQGLHRKQARSGEGSAARAAQRRLLQLTATPRDPPRGPVAPTWRSLWATSRLLHPARSRERRRLAAASEAGTLSSPVPPSSRCTSLGMKAPGGSVCAGGRAGRRAGGRAGGRQACAWAGPLGLLPARLVQLPPQPQPQVCASPHAAIVVSATVVGPMCSCPHTRSPPPPSRALARPPRSARPPAPARPSPRAM